jgi:F-box and WD-40 domain protein CDC4
VVSGGYDGRICRWDAFQSSRPVVLGTHPGPVAAVAALENGRVVSGGTAGDVRIWDPDTPGADPVKIGCYGGRLNALAVLGDHVIAGGDDGCLWIWDSAGHKAGSFSGHNSWLTSLTAFRNGYVISGGTDGRMVMWELDGQGMRRISVVGCSVRALAAGQARTGNGCLVAAHADSGVSYWTLSVPK